MMKKINSFTRFHENETYKTINEDNIYAVRYDYVAKGLDIDIGSLISNWITSPRKYVLKQDGRLHIP
jgi:hypothetical protein